MIYYNYPGYHYPSAYNPNIGYNKNSYNPSSKQQKNNLDNSINKYSNNYYQNNPEIKKKNIKDETLHKSDNDVFFEILGIKLYFDDILLICLIFFLYNEGVKDQYLFISLILLLLS